MAHGGNVWQGAGPSAWLDFSANLRPEGAPDWVWAALRTAIDEAVYYPEPDMARARAALERHLRLPEGFALPTAGGAAAIDLAARLEATGMTRFTPCFSEYAQAGRRRGQTVESISLLTGRHALGDPAALASARLSEGRAVWLCNPLNPVGIAFSRPAVERLLEAVEAKKGWLIVDEAFIEYCPGHSCGALLAAHERLVITGSMTKILGIPGVRLGYLCAHPKTLARLERERLPWSLGCFAEAVLRALPDHAEELQADCVRNAARRERMRAGLEAAGAFVYPSEAAFLLADFGRPVDRLAARLKARGILVRECMDFEGIDDGRHLRLAVKDDASNDRLIAALREET